MAATTPARLRDGLAMLAHHGEDVSGFSYSAARLLARTVPFDGFCMLTVDPATGLPTGEVVENGLPPAATARLVDIEIGGTDVNSLGVLSHSPQPAASLSAATGGDLSRSQRHRELKQPNGFGDELRVALRDGATMWGCLTLQRAYDRRPFTADDVDLLESVSGYLTEALRRAVLLGVMSTGGSDVDEAAGLLLLRPDNVITRADSVARRWLDELRGSRDEQLLPLVVSTVAARARTIAQGNADTAVARARVPTASGIWLQVSGTTVDDEPDTSTVVILEPAPPRDLAPLVADAYGLTTREREVVRHVASGLPTTAIARRLWISHWTVQDHLKSAFTKVGVGTRGELVARIFLTPHTPQLEPPGDRSQPPQPESGPWH